MSSMVENLVSRARTAAVLGELAVDKAIDRAVDAVLESGAIETIDESTVRHEMNQHIFGFGALQNLIDDSSIEEIWVNSPGKVFVAVAGRSRQIDLTLEQHELESIVERMLRPTGRRLDRSSPFVDASLPDGSRLHVAIPDITRAHWSVNIRKFSKRSLGLHDLAMMGALSFDQAEFLAAQMRDGKNILVSGATQAGKTTMLGALLSAVDPNERVISVEETFELRLPINDWVAMQTRQASLE
ncbi:MAG: CpaF family protein, partial [Rhodoluna sp.]